MTNKPSFGFDKLAEFKPRPEAAAAHKVDNKADVEAIDEVAMRHGFESRERASGRRKRSKVIKQTEQFNLRAHIEDIDLFVEYAEKHNLSYRVVFEQMVKRFLEG